MSFTRANALGWALYEIFTSAQANHIDINQSRAIDGYAGGTYNTSAFISINNQLKINSTGAVAANVDGIITTGKGTSSGIAAFGGGTDGAGVVGTGGATNGEGVIGIGAGTGQGVVGFGNGTGSIVGTYNEAGVVGRGGSTAGVGVVGEGTNTHVGVYGLGGTTGGGGVGVTGTGGGTGGTGITGYGTATGSGHGIIGYASGTAKDGVIGIGITTGSGVAGTGGATGGVGVYGAGGATGGTGVYGAGGATNGVGVKGVGGATNGDGMEATGTGTGNGIAAVGGVTAGSYAATCIGGGTNGHGIYAESKGTGNALVLRRASGTGGSHINMITTGGDPTGPAEGDIWAVQGTGYKEVLAFYNGNSHQLFDTWCKIGIAAGVAAINTNNNVASVSVASGTTVDVTFDRSFAAASYAAVVTIGDVTGGRAWIPVITTQAVGSFSFRIYDVIGAGWIAPNAGGTTCQLYIVVKGYM